MVDKAKIDSEIGWIGARLREPSSYAGLALLLTGLFHLANANAWAASLTAIGIGVGGIIAIVLPEGTMAAK